MHRAAERVIALYDAHGRQWDVDRRRERQPDGTARERHWLERLAGLLPAAAPVLDVGCGSGTPIAQTLIALGFTVTGVDASGTMMELFRSRVPAAAAHLADMRGLELGTQFHGLIAWNSLFHLSANDQRAMFPTFARHAASGAALLFTSGTGHGEAIGRLHGEPLYHASLDPQEYAALLAENGFALREHVVDDPHCHRNVWFAQHAVSTG